VLERIWLIFAEAPKYRSVRTGDNDKASALLSNPYAALSGRQQRAINLEREHVANGVAILGRG